jgi:hypothetical protein
LNGRQRAGRSNDFDVQGWLEILRVFMRFKTVTPAKFGTVGTSLLIPRVIDCKTIGLIVVVMMYKGQGNTVDMDGLRARTWIAAPSPVHLHVATIRLPLNDNFGSSAEGG